MSRAIPDPNEAAEVRRYALLAARRELARLLALFPELSQDVPAGHPAAILPAIAAAHNQRVLRHWRKTAKPANPPASNGRPAVSVRAALEPLLTATPQDTPALRAKLDASGYVHTGSTRLNNRIAQEAIALVRAGKAVKTKRGWRLAKGAPAK